MQRLPSLGPRGEGWVLMQLLLLSLLAMAGLTRGGEWDGPAASAAAVLGLAALAGGGLLFIQGVRDLGRNLTPVPRPRDDAQLVVTGAFGLVRHPLYGGLMSAALGWALLTASPLAVLLAAALAILLDLKSRREEAWLTERFPGYGQYAARTRRLIPWLY